MHLRAKLGGVLAILTAALTLSATSMASAAPPPIVGGQPATETYSFMVSIQGYYGSHQCGAALISPTWLATAAHCGRPYQARIGSTHWRYGGEVIRIVERRALGGDMALLRLARPSGHTPIPMADSAPAGTRIRLLGWGQTCPTRGCGPAPENLQQLDTSVLNDYACSIGPDELCVNGGNGQGACFGDSGGPAIAGSQGSWRLVGTTSRGTDWTCATSPSIYNDVTYHRAQIERIIRYG